MEALGKVKERDSSWQIQEGDISEISREIREYWNNSGLDDDHVECRVAWAYQDDETYEKEYSNDEVKRGCQDEWKNRGYLSHRVVPRSP